MEDYGLWIVCAPVVSARNDAESVFPTDPERYPFRVSPLVKKIAHLFDSPLHPQRILFLVPHDPLQSDHAEVTKGHWANFKL